MSNNQNVTNVFIGALITSFVGGVLLLFTDFAGWDGSNYYLGFYEYGYIGSNLENPLSIIPFLILAGLLFYCTYISFMGMQGQKIPLDVLNRAYIFSVIVMVLCVGLGALFAIIVTLEDVWWWFDAGFYGGVIGSALTVIFLNQAKKAMVE